MELLTIQHEDFTMYVECSKYEAIWGKAVRNVGRENLLTTYTWTDGVKSAAINDEPIENGGQAKAVFFDNAEYPIWVEFGSHVSKAQFGSIRRRTGALPRRKTRSQTRTKAVSYRRI